MDTNSPIPIKLRQLLTLQKPAVTCTTKASQNSVNPKLPKLTITRWGTFNRGNLDKKFSGVLDATIQAPPQDLIPPFQSGLQIQNIAHLKPMIERNDKVLRTALECWQPKGLKGTALRSGLSSRSSDGMNKPNGDHVVTLDNQPPKHLVVGLARPSSRWSVVRLQASGAEGRKDLQVPVQQLAAECRRAGTRFGYIQTDEALTAVCFTWANGESEGVAAVRSIPWTKYGLNMLTTDLALWWLFNLAWSSDSDDPVARGEDIQEVADEKLDDQDEEHAAHLKNHSNAAELPGLSIMSPKYQMAGPDNQLAPDNAVEHFANTLVGGHSSFPSARPDPFMFPSPHPFFGATADGFFAGSPGDLFSPNYGGFTFPSTVCHSIVPEGGLLESRVNSPVADTVHFHKGRAVHFADQNDAGDLDVDLIKDASSMHSNIEYEPDGHALLQMEE